MPPGHPEGYLEGSATIYAEAARAIRAAEHNEAPGSDVLYPDVGDGLRGVPFVDACVRSSKADSQWVKLALWIKEIGESKKPGP